MSTRQAQDADGMPRTAFMGVAGARIAALAVAACTLSSCGGDKAPADAAVTGEAAGIEISGPAAQRPAGAPQAAAAAGAMLDSSSWILPPPFYAAGEEPFWRLDIEDGWFTFKRSGLAVIEAPLVQPARTGGADVFDTPPLKVTIRREGCDTSGGGHTDIAAVVTFDDIEFGGCAFGGAAGVAVANSAEAATVVESVKVIDACLARLGDPALVTAVYPREGERTAVALRARDGSIYECAVEPDGSTIAFLDAMEPRSAGPWMSRMRFLRAGVADSVKCADAAEVRDGDKTLGRLLSKTCKF
jgi:uncharacterized membrane protein